MQLSSGKVESDRFEPLVRTGPLVPQLPARGAEPARSSMWVELKGPATITVFNALQTNSAPNQLGGHTVTILNQRKIYFFE